MLLTYGLNNLIEELLDESAKTEFIAKFGETMLDRFDKAKQRLKNKKFSTDYGQYLNMSTGELAALILSLYDSSKDTQKKRMLSGEYKNIRGNYKYLGEADGFKVYQPLDAQASMDLGIDTGWCTAGRYGHAGHPDYTPDSREAITHFEEYTEEKGAKLFYILDANSLFGVYALEVYPKEIYTNYDFLWNTAGYSVCGANCKLYDFTDNNVPQDFEKLPQGVLDLINKELGYELYIKLVDLKKTNGLFINNGGIIVNHINEFMKDPNLVIPDNILVIDEYSLSAAPIISVEMSSVEFIDRYAFINSSKLEKVNIKDSLKTLEVGVFYGCDKLKEIRLPNTLKKLDETALPPNEALIVYYDGTEKEWRELTKRSNVDYCLECDKIYLKDGYIDSFSGEVVLDK